MTDMREWIYADNKLQRCSIVCRCALQYILLHLLGYQLSLDDLKAFRQLDSKTPGHPEAGHTDGAIFRPI